MLTKKLLRCFPNYFCPSMSLKTVHIVFIVFATAISFMFGLWALIRGMEDASGAMIGMGLIGLICGIGLVLYGVTFWRKIRELT